MPGRNRECAAPILRGGETWSSRSSRVIATAAFPWASGKRRVQLGPRSSWRGDCAEFDDLVADRQRRHELRALQRFGLVRQRLEPALEAAVRGFRSRRQGAREAAQIAQVRRGAGAFASLARAAAAGGMQRCGAQPAKIASAVL